MTKNINDEERWEDMERLNIIRARIHRSLDDPRPAFSVDEVSRSLEGLFAKVRKDGGRDLETLYRNHDPESGI